MIDPVFDEIESRAIGEQKAGVEILLGQDLEQQRRGENGHRGVRDRAKIRPEHEVGDVRRDDGEADAGRQRRREQNLQVFFKVRARARRALGGERSHRHRHEGGGDADRRNDQALADDVEAGAELTGGADAGQVGEQKSVGHSPTARGATARSSTETRF